MKTIFEIVSFAEFGIFVSNGGDEKKKKIIRQNRTRTCTTVIDNEESGRDEKCDVTSTNVQSEREKPNNIPKRTADNGTGELHYYGSVTQVRGSVLQYVVEKKTHNNTMKLARWIQELGMHVNSD